MRFARRTLFATGAGSGIAAATARRFSAEGGHVAVVDADGDRAAAVAAALPNAIAIEADVASEVELGSAVAEAAERLGGIDCVLTAAGYADFGAIEEWSLERWNRLIAVHVSGTFLACRCTVPFLRERGGGSIVTVASVAALVAEPTNAVPGAAKATVPTGNAAYGAAKAAITGFSRHLARDLARDGIRVNAIAPGSVRTAMTVPLYTERGAGDYERGAAWSGAVNPQNRVAEPEEIAAAVCFLLSDEASFVTGHVLVADGGQTIT
jgi:NAD(P)-dependent dehydrogenase (short-subunit alcohol dehydrogenase family)